MTEIEEEFFKTFEIEPKYQDTCTVEEKYWSNEELANKYGTFDMYMNAKCGNQENCTTECSCAYQKEIYPPITDRILLELICVLNQHYCNNYQCATLLVGSTVEEVKRCILVECLKNATHLKTVIRALFEEGAEDE